MEYRLHHCLSKFDRSESKANLLFFQRLYGLGFLSKIYWSLLDHDLLAKIWEKAISILAGKLNSGRTYLITAVPRQEKFHSGAPESFKQNLLKFLP